MPGITFLARKFPRLLALPVIFFIVPRYSLHPRAFPIPKYFLALLSVALLPGQTFVSAWYQDWQNIKKRRVLGLEQILTVEDDQYLGGLGLGMLKTVAKSFSEGEFLSEY